MLDIEIEGQIATGVYIDFGGKELGWYQEPQNVHLREDIISDNEMAKLKAILGIMAERKRK